MWWWGGRGTEPQPAARRRAGDRRLVGGPVGAPRACGGCLEKAAGRVHGKLGTGRREWCVAGQKGTVSRRGLVWGATEHRKLEPGNS